MIAFLDSIIAHLNAPTVIHEPIKVGMLDIDEEGIAIRLIPSSPGERYVDGRSDMLQFQVYTKFQDQLEAISKMTEITNKLTYVNRGAIDTVGGDFTILTCDVYTSPNFVEKTDNMEYIYTALFQSEIEY